MYFKSRYSRSQNTFKQFIALHESNPNLGILVLNLPMEQGNFYENQVGFHDSAAVSKSLGFQTITQFVELQLRLRKTKWKDRRSVSAFMFLRKRLYDQLAGFDENFFMYGEDIDISHRNKIRVDQFYLSETKVIHFKGESTPKNKAYETRFFNAMSYYYNKNFSHSGFWILYLCWGLFV